MVSGGFWGLLGSKTRAWLPLPLDVSTFSPNLVQAFSHFFWLISEKETNSALFYAIAGVGVCEIVKIFRPLVFFLFLLPLISKLSSQYSGGILK